jgi:hypothetical protein
MLGQQTHFVCQQYGIVLLKTEDTKIVFTQLYGQNVKPSPASWG